MRLADVPTLLLLRFLRATERMAGPASYEVCVLRAELERRRRLQAGEPERPAPGRTKGGEA